MVAYIKQKIIALRNSDLATLVVTIIASLLIFVVGVCGGLRLNIVIGSVKLAPSTVGEFIWGLLALAVGCIFFGRRAVGICLPKNLSRYWYWIFILLIAIAIINVVATPLTSLKLDQLDQCAVIEVIVTGFWEEAVFRGALLAFLLRMFDRWKYSYLFSVLVSSFLFALPHVGQSVEFSFYRFGLGVMFAMIVLRTESIWIVVILHILNNGLEIMGGSLEAIIKVPVVILLTFISLWIVCRMAGADQMTNPSENRQKLAP